MTTSDSPPPYDFQPGSTPLLVSIPHAGTALPAGLQARMTTTAARLPDTDWHVDRLYDFVTDLGASVLRANYSRFAVDLNRPLDDTPLYSTAMMGLFPSVLFNGEPVYRDDATPGAVLRTHGLDQIWRPYHAKIAQTLAELKACHGYALLFDAHSIRSRVPRLFDGQLPDFNIGSNAGRSAADDLVTRLCRVTEQAEGYTSVLNGRFKGGHITRQYGDPDNAIHAVQLELSQVTYMDEAYPFDYWPERAVQVRPVLHAFVQTLLGWRPLWVGLKHEARRSYGAALGSASSCRALLH